MRRSFSALLVTAAIVLAAGVAFAADSKVKGTVTDSSGQPIKGARIVLSDAKAGRKLKMKSKKDGSFYRRGVLPSTYKLTVEKDGYTAHIVEDVRVQAGIDREFDIVLRTVAERQSELRQKRIEEGDDYLAGFDAFEKGDYEAALASADAAIAKKPDDPKGYDMKAKALVRMKRYAEAIPLLEKELTLPGAAPDAESVLAGANYNAGVFASRQEQTDEAIGYWLRALELGYPEKSLHKLIGQSYLQKAEFGSAQKCLQAYVAANPDAADKAEVELLLAELGKLSAP